MATISRLGFIFSTITAGSYTFNVTPSLNAQILLVIAVTGTSTPSASAITDGQGGTYSLLRAAGKLGTDNISVFVRNGPIGQNVLTNFSSGTIPGSPTGGGMFVYQITGLTQFGPQSARQAASNTNQTAGTTPTVNLGVAMLTTNPGFGFVFNGTNPATMTPRALWTEDQDIGYNTPTTGYETMLINSGETASSIAWGSTSATAYAVGVVEFDANQLPAARNLPAMGAGN